MVYVLQDVMGHGTTYRIAIMLDSPYHMYDQTRFSVTEAGVQDVEEYKSTEPEW